MIRRSLQLIAGLLLCGCTVNNFSSTTTSSISNRLTAELVTSTYDFHESDESLIQPTDPGEPAQTALRTSRINSDCMLYVPLPVPKPVKINFKELESAESGKEINAIALRNVRELHQQLNGYAAKQKIHYSEYVKRCVVK
jgi:hypothetical protein